MTLDEYERAGSVRRMARLLCLAPSTAWLRLRRAGVEMRPVGRPATTTGVGARFGSLVVRRLLPDDRRDVVCDCGRAKVVHRANLASGRTTSCGACQEPVMEKYGVSTPKPGGKTASGAPPTCPLCGKAAILDGAVVRCPTHGSAPFEGK